jgi:hypothetical protein
MDMTDLTARIPRIPDDQALTIDAAIAGLPEYYRGAIEQVYLRLEPYRSLPRHRQRARDVALGMLAIKLLK